MKLTRKKVVQVASEATSIMFGATVMGTIILVLGTAFVLYRLVDPKPQICGTTL